MTNAEVRRLDAQALDLPDGSFDAVISNFVFHLLPVPGLAAAEVWRVLRPGGRFVASFPTGSGPAWAFLGEVFGRYAKLATGRIPLPFRPQFDLTAILVGAGFEVVATTDQRGAFTFTDEDAWWQWAWSHGMRSVFELLPPHALDQVKHEVFAELARLRTTEGIPLPQQASAVVAAKR